MVDKTSYWLKATSFIRCLIDYAKLRKSYDVYTYHRNVLEKSRSRMIEYYDRDVEAEKGLSEEELVERDMHVDYDVLDGVYVDFKEFFETLAIIEDKAKKAKPKKLAAKQAEARKLFSELDELSPQGMEFEEFLHTLLPATDKTRSPKVAKRNTWIARRDLKKVLGLIKEYSRGHEKITPDAVTMMAMLIEANNGH